MKISELIEEASDNFNGLKNMQAGFVLLEEARGRAELLEKYIAELEKKTTELQALLEAKV